MDRSRLINQLYEILSVEGRVVFQLESESIGSVRNSFKLEDLHVYDTSIELISGNNIINVNTDNIIIYDDIFDEWIIKNNAASIYLSAA